MRSHAESADWSIRPERNPPSPSQGDSIVEWMNILENDGHRFVTWAQGVTSRNEPESLYIGDAEGNCPLAYHHDFGRSTGFRRVEFYVIEARRLETWVLSNAPQSITIWRWDLLNDEFSRVAGLSVNMSYPYPDPYGTLRSEQSSVHITWAGGMLSDAHRLSYIY